MERRGRIPVAKFRTAEGKPRSRSRVRDIKANTGDPDFDVFTLLEENFAIKDENENMKEKLNEYTERIKILQEKNEELEKEVSNLKKQNNQRNQITTKNKTNRLRDENLTPQNTKAERIQSLNEPNINEFESLLDIQKEKALTWECFQKLMDEFSELKTSYNTIELQLYEANERISELLEQQSHLEEENKLLRIKEKEDPPNKSEASTELSHGKPEEVQNKGDININSNETKAVVQQSSGNITRPGGYTYGERTVEMEITL